MFHGFSQPPATMTRTLEGVGTGVITPIGKQEPKPNILSDNKELQFQVIQSTASRNHQVTAQQF